MLVPLCILQSLISLLSSSLGSYAGGPEGCPDPGCSWQISASGAGVGWVRRGLAASGGQTRETSAWKLEERRALGLTRVSMETCVLHVAPLLPPHGCWDLEVQPRTP